MTGGRAASQGSDVSAVPWLSPRAVGTALAGLAVGFDRVRPPPFLERRVLSRRRGKLTASAGYLHGARRSHRRGPRVWSWARGPRPACNNPCQAMKSASCAGVKIGGYGTRVFGVID